MCNVFENLYIGGLDDACNQSLKLKLNITCILTVERWDFEFYVTTDQL